jgi:DNA mismatch repair ATPase MutL
VWIFDDPRGEDVPEEERLEKFREIRDEIEQKIRDWLEHPEEELARLRDERERERKERLDVARREAESRNAYIAYDADRASRENRSMVPEHLRATLV